MAVLGTASLRHQPPLAAYLDLGGRLRALGMALAIFAMLFASSLPLTAATLPAQTIWRLLDYIAVDYPEAVVNGEVVNQGEFDEMREFSATARKLIAELPATSAKETLDARSLALQNLISAKSAAPEIAKAARSLAADLLKAYPVPLAPGAAPDLARGKILYAEQCASCHGETGDGKGPQSEGNDPPPIAFTDEARARERSVFALYQVIEQGLDGTSMPSFAELPSQDRWALAFYAGTLAYPESAQAAGKAVWEGDPALRKRVDLEKLVGTTPAAFAEEVGAEDAAKLVAFLRRQPQSVEAGKASGRLTLARTKLDEALAAYGRGDRKTAAETERRPRRSHCLPTSTASSR